MTLKHTAELTDRLTTLVKEVGPLHTIAAIGFDDDRTARVEECIQHLTRGGPWSFLDLRSANRDEAVMALREQLGARVLVLATKIDAAPRPLLNLIGAAVDKSQEVDLGDHTPSVRPTEQSVFVLCQGCTNIDNVSRELKRIAYWEFVP